MTILTLTDICKDYQQGKEPVRVLKNINLTVEEGDYLAIMGPSGSGKTTLMNIIGCLDVPTSGTYTLRGQDLKNLNDDALADIRNKHLGFVFQSFHLMPKMDALDNVALPLLYAGVPLKERRERAAEALKAVGLEERIHFLPNQLSGGQCQRVAIARAMVGKPDLLLADEPTGALDTKSGNQIMEIFRQLSQEGMTIIMITHEPSIAACANKTYHILDGELRTGETVEEPSSDAASDVPVSAEDSLASPETAEASPITEAETAGESCPETECFSEMEAADAENPLPPEAGVLPEETPSSQEPGCEAEPSEETAPSGDSEVPLEPQDKLPDAFHPEKGGLNNDQKD